MKPETINDENIINKISKSIGTVVLVFEKSWSGACLLLEPILLKLSDTFEDSIKIIKINIDQNSELVANYGITQTPTIFLLKNGIIKETIVGLVPFEVLKDKIKD